MDGRKNGSRRQAVVIKGRDEGLAFVLVGSDRSGKILEILADELARMPFYFPERQKCVLLGG